MQARRHPSCIDPLLDIEIGLNLVDVFDDGSGELRSRRRT